jgi:hypothetical protein
MNVELRNCHDVDSAIEGHLEALAGSGVIRRDEVSVRSIEKRVKMDHVARHIVGPFEHLWADVDQECIRGPTSKDHNFCRGMVDEEKRHRGAPPNGLVPDLVGVEPKRFETPEYGAECVGAIS